MTDPGGSTTTPSPADEAPSTGLDALTVHDLLQRLASREPIPGGGSAAALAGSLGAALLSMVAALTEGRTSSAEDAAAIREISIASVSACSELTALATLDASAYDAVVQARRLPRGTDAERSFRAMQIGHATRHATEVPLRTARAAAATLTIAERLMPIGNPHASSDVGVAAHLAAAAVRGAALNVRVNLPHLPDLDPDDELAGARDELDTLIAESAAAEARLSTAVRRRMEG